MSRTLLVILLGLAVCAPPWPARASASPAAVGVNAEVAHAGEDAGGDASGTASSEEAAPTALPRNEALSLGMPSEPALTRSGEASGSDSSSGLAGGWVVRTLGALGAVIALMLGLRWMLQHAGRASGSFRAQLGAGGRSPSGVLFVLGRYPVSRGMSLVLVRVNTRVLLLSQSAEGFRTLSELTDTDEVAQIIRQTEHAGGGSATAGFEKMLRSLAGDRTLLDEPTGNEKARGTGVAASELEAKPSVTRRLDLRDTDAPRVDPGNQNNQEGRS